MGAAILYTLASWQFRGLKVDGEIIGVRRRGPQYHGVYRYLLPSGDYRQATSVQGNNSPRGLQTGRHVPIHVVVDRPDEAREEHAPMLWALAAALLQLNEAAAGRSSDTFLFPVVQYTMQDGSLTRFHDRIGARPSPFKVGDIVPVMYVPGKSSTASIDRGASNWEPLGGLAVIGVLLTGLGFVAMRRR